MKEFIDWDLIPTNKNRGTEKVKCPNCIDRRTNKSDRSLSVNHNTGLSLCHYCGVISIRDKNERTDKVYEPLPQTWQNFTNLSDNMVKWCRDERKIRQETLIKFGVTEEKFYQPKHGKEVNNIVFNYFEGSKVVNKKYRSGAKGFTQTKGGKPILYNINSVIGADEVWIVEGEFDALALSEVGIEAVVSIPNGANDADDYWINSEPYIKEISKFIIATDNDTKGIEVRDKIAQRLGRYRCEFVEFSGKDANEDLISGVLSNSVKQRKRFPVSGTFSAEDLSNDVMRLYENGLPETIKIKSKGWEYFNDLFTVMRGHLVTGTGIPSHGKSTFTEFYCLNLVKDYGMKVSFFSPEHSPMELHQSNFIQKVIGKPFFQSHHGERVSRSEIERYNSWAKEKIYLTATSGTEKPTWNWLFEKFKEQIYCFGIDVFVIDAFNKLLFDKGIRGKEAIDQVLTELTSFAQANNVILFLIAHPTKMSKDDKGNYSIPTLYDVSGSADFRNQTHDGFAIHRYFKTEFQDDYSVFVNLKTKFSFQGNIGGQIEILYDNQTGRYYPRSAHADKSDWTLEFSSPKQLNLTPNVDFDNLEAIDECPF